MEGKISDIPKERSKKLLEGLMVGSFEQVEDNGVRKEILEQLQFKNRIYSDLQKFAQQCFTGLTQTGTTIGKGINNTFITVRKEYNWLRHTQRWAICLYLVKNYPKSRMRDDIVDETRIRANRVTYLIKEVMKEDNEFRKKKGIGDDKKIIEEVNKNEYKLTDWGYKVTGILGTKEQNA